MRKTAMLLCASALLMPGFALAQTTAPERGATDANPSTLSTPTPPDSTKKAGMYNGRSSSDMTPAEQTKPNSTDMHPSGPDSQESK